MKSNEPGLDPTAKSADVKSREPDNSHTSTSVVLQTQRPPHDLMSYERDLNNRLVKQSFGANVQGTRGKEKKVQPSTNNHLIEKPGYKENTSKSPKYTFASSTVVSAHDASAIPYFPDLKSVPSTFPYQFEPIPSRPAHIREHNPNLVQSSHSVPIYQAVKGRPQPDPHQKPLPHHSVYRSPEGDPTFDQRSPSHGNYYLPLYSPPPIISDRPLTSSTYSPLFESSRLNQHQSSDHHFGPTHKPPDSATTSGYLHPLQPVRPSSPKRPDHEQKSEAPYPYFIPKTTNDVQYGSTYQKPTPSPHLPYPPYISSYADPRTTLRPYVSYSAPSPTPVESSSRDQPLQYLDGPGPGAIVGSSRMEPSVYYSDEPEFDSEKLVNEVFSYAPHRTGPEIPPTDNSDTSSGPPYDPYGPDPGYEKAGLHLSPVMRGRGGTSPEESTRQRLASYYKSVKETPATGEKVRSQEVPSVLLGIQSALGLETGVKMQSSGSGGSDGTEPENYNPSHYPSYQQILLLRKGLKNLIPLLTSGKKSATNASITASGSSLSAVTAHRPDDRFSALMSAADGWSRGVYQ